jgi:hypothetical protein
LPISCSRSELFHHTGKNPRLNYTSHFIDDISLFRRHMASERYFVNFIEMNTHIQVEHRVAGMAYRKDLIYEQLLVAAGEELGYTQDDLKSYGFAVECRINAEDPEHGFEASPGTIERFIPPESKKIIVEVSGKILRAELSRTISGRNKSEENGYYYCRWIRSRVHLSHYCSQPISRQGNTHHP